MVWLTDTTVVPWRLHVCLAGCIPTYLPGRNPVPGNLVAREDERSLLLLLMRRQGIRGSDVMKWAWCGAVRRGKGVAKVTKRREVVS